MIRKLPSNQRGFTIIELLIATTVLSVILVLASVMMTSIGRLYQKGINQSRVQGAARDTVDNLSDDLQLSDSLAPSASSGDATAYCIGSIRYVAIIGRQLGNGPDAGGGPAKSPHVLWRDKTPATGCDTVIPANDPDGVELMPDNSRLLAFSISNKSPYLISVGIAYGDFDLLNVNQTTPVWSLAVNCRGDIGDQFCATAKLTTTATKRL